MSGSVVVVDVALVVTLVLVGWGVLSSTDLLKAVVLFVAFGLLMTLSWVRLDAVDVALAEAAIGAGFTGALFLAGLSRLRRQEQRRREVTREPEVEQGR